MASSPSRDSCADDDRRTTPEFSGSAMKRLICATLVVLASGSVAAADLERGERHVEPAREEITSYALDANISEAEALKRLRDQARLGRLADAAAVRLEESYGGIWVQSPGDERIKLGIAAPTAGTLPEHRTTQARAAIRDAGLAGKVDVVAVPHSEQALRDLQLRIEHELLNVNRNAEITIDAVADVRVGVVDVFTPAVSQLTDAQAKFLRTARERFGPTLRFRESPGKPILQPRQRDLSSARGSDAR
jgi:hypothetical protein